MSTTARSAAWGSDWASRTSTGLPANPSAGPDALALRACAGWTCPPILVEVRDAAWTGTIYSPPDAGPSGPSVPNTADAVRRVREQSGLTWSELAHLFGVTRRAAHAWAAGGRMSARHAAFLPRLSSYLQQHDAGSPSATRSALLAPRGDTRSLYEELAALSRRDVPQSPEGVRPRQLLDARHDDPDPTGRLLEVEAEE